MSRSSPIALAEVAEILNGKTPSKSEQRSHGHPVLKIKDVSDLGEFRGPFDSFVDADLANAYAGRQVRAGDTLILNAAHNAEYVGSKTYRVQPPVVGALATGEWLVIRPVESRLDPGFLFHWVNSTGARQMIRNVVKGIHLYPKDVARLRIPLPPLAEQRRIAEILDKADALRIKRRAALAQLDTLTQSIFFDMFGDPTTNPKGWPVLELDDIASKITDGEHLNPPFSSSGMPIVMAGDVLDDSVEIESAKRVDLNLGLRFRRKCDPDVGDLLLVSRGATIGRQCVIDTDRAFCLMGSVILIKRRTDKMESRFLSAHLKHPAVRAALYKTSGSTAQQAIYLKDLRKLRCMLPPLPLQCEFARRVEYVVTMKSRCRVFLRQLDSLFFTIQQDAFAGV